MTEWRSRCPRATCPRSARSSRTTSRWPAAPSYLKSAIETDVPENKARILGQGEKVILEAMQQNGQEKNPAAWYYLGRIYLQRGQSATRPTARSPRPSSSAPDCAKDIAGYRRNAWVALVKAGSKFEEDKNADSALAMYQQAGSIYRGSPIAFYQTAAILNEKGQPDSAEYYFGLAAAVVSTDTTDIKVRNRSAFNQGALLLNGKKYDQAAVVFEQYLKWAPTDNEAKRGLAAAYRGNGKIEQAQALEKELVAAGVAPGAAEPDGIAEPDAAGVNAVQRQEVRGCRGGVREGGGCGAQQSRGPQQPQQHLSRTEGRPQAGGDRAASWWPSSR